MAKKQTIENAIVEACNGDKDLAIFFTEWLKCGRNATKAYKILHPDVTMESAAVLGSNLLRKIKIEPFLATYNLGVDRYFTQLDEALKADKWNDFTGEREPDHKTRLPYHNKLGNLLGIEKKDTPPIGNTFNFQQIITDNEKYRDD